MTRIRIDDLLPIENPTQEELEEVFGAGRPSFKPSFEALEAREVYAVGLNQALLANAAPPHAADGPQVHMVQESAPQVQVDMSLMYNALARGTMPQGEQTVSSLMEQDRNKIAEEASKLLKDHIIGGGKFANVWGLYNDGRITQSTEISGDEIRVKFWVYNRAETNPARVELNFTGKNFGGQKIYTLTSAGLHDYEYKWYSPLGIPGLFEGNAKDLFRDNFGSIKCSRFWEADFYNRIMRQAEQIWGVKPNTFAQNGFSNGFQAIEGGFTVVFFTGKNRDGLVDIRLTFKFDDAQIAKGYLKASECAEGFFSRKDWIETGDKRIHDLALQAEWKLS